MGSAPHSPEEYRPIDTIKQELRMLERVPKGTVDGIYFANNTACTVCVFFVLPDVHRGIVVVPPIPPRINVDATLFWDLRN